MNEDKPLAPGLYLVATPIGNLEDITLRALRVLRLADKVACEDTRQTQKLLSHFDIHKPTVSYHLFNEAARSEELIAELAAGARGLRLYRMRGRQELLTLGRILRRRQLRRGLRCIRFREPMRLWRRWSRVGSR